MVPAGDGGQGGEQLGPDHGLGQAAVHAGGQIALALVGHDVGGQRQDRHRCRPGRAAGGSAGWPRCPSITGICMSISTTSDALAARPAPPPRPRPRPSSTSWPCRPQHLAQQLAVGRDVVGHQHAQRPDRRRRRCRSARPPPRRRRARTAARTRTGCRWPGSLSRPIVAAHRRDQRLADREPEPAAAIVPGGRAVGLDEGLEQLGLALARDADAGVPDLEAQPAGVAAPAGSRTVSVTLPWR